MQPDLQWIWLGGVVGGRFCTGHVTTLCYIGFFPYIRLGNQELTVYIACSTYSIGISAI